MKPKHELLKWGIKNTKMRIKHFERQGMGTNVMFEKAKLQKQERTMDKLKQEGKK